MVTGWWLASSCVTPEHAPPADATAGTAIEGTPAQLHAAETEIPLVPLNREALDARVHAQRSALGSDAGLFEDDAGKPVPWISPQQGFVPGEPSFDDELLDSLPGSSGLGTSVALTGPRANGNMLGLFEPIDGERRPLAHFHDALRALRDGHDPDGKVRVAIYGASHTEADVYPQYLRSYLQDRFGDGGHGFVMPAPPWKGYGHVDVRVEGFEHWRTEHAQRREARRDGWFGLLGASISSKNPRAFARVIPSAAAAASRYEISFLAQPKGGSFELYVDGRRHGVVDTAAAQVAAGYHGFDLPEAQHTIELRPRGDGEVRLFGLTLERAGAGVVVDTLGIRGTRASNALQWDDAIWADNLRRRAPDLVILAYGTNEATDAEQPIADYEQRLRATVQRYRDAAPQASCLLVGPGDFPQAVPGGGWLPRARVGEIIAVQDRLAAEHGCGFWDMRAFMGGELAMLQWMNADPPMAAGDHVHLTRRGYVRMGMALADAIMTAFDGDDPLRARTAKPRGPEPARDPS
jgi:lysophospholipase L1-like esterase